MAIVHWGYRFVDPRGAPGPWTAPTDPPSDALADYLLAHCTEVRKKAQLATSGPAIFSEHAAGARFQMVRTGSNTQFEEAGADLAERLQTAMDDRSKAGFLVALQLAEGDKTEAAVLKLDISERVGAAAARRNGVVMLEPIANLLDRAGGLDKGAIVPDQRPDSDAIVADRLGAAAQYFLRAMGLRQEAARNESTPALIRLVARIAPERTESFVSQLAAEQAPVVVDDLLSRLDAPEAEIRQIRAALDKQPRALRIVDPIARPPRVEIRAGEIAITGLSVQAARGVQWSQLAGGWRITIDVQDEPKRIFR